MPLAAWTLWLRRRQLTAPQVLLPLAFLGITLLLLAWAYRPREIPSLLLLPTLAAIEELHLLPEGDAQRLREAYLFLRRLRRSPTAFCGLIVIALLLLVALFAPWLARLVARKKVQRVTIPNQHQHRHRYSQQPRRRQRLRQLNSRHRKHRQQHRRKHRSLRRKLLRHRKQKHREATNH